MLLQVGVIGIVVNPNGILFAAICEDLGLRAGDLSLYYMLRSLTVAFMAGITTKLVFKYRINLVIAVLGFTFSLSVTAMAFFDSLWQWYISAIFNGIGMSWSPAVIPLVLNNWFKKRNGSIIGITMASSGVVSALYSPVLSGFIENFGWRQAALISGSLVFAMAVLPSFFFLIANPEEIGLEPYGVEEMQKQGAVQETGLVQPHSIPTMVFAFTLVALIGPGTVMQFNAQLPIYANAAGYAFSVGAALTSLSMIGNLCGKLGAGILTDRLGVYKAGFLVSGLIGISMLFLLLRSSLGLICAGALLFGLSYSLCTTVPSLLYIDLYGEAAYQGVVSRQVAINQFISAPLAAGFPYIYDFAGSFDPVFVYGILMCTIAAILFLYMEKFSLKRMTL